MANLTASHRRTLAPSEFGLPEQRKYPVDTRGRAIAAKAYASKEEHEGRLTSAQESKIDRKADAKLGHPRDHALAMASADHLHRMGHISSSQHKEIRGKAEAGMAKAKRTFGAIG